MPHLNFYKVQSGTVERLYPMVAPLNADLSLGLEGFKHLNIYRLITEALSNGISRWLLTYNDQRGQMVVIY